MRRNLLSFYNYCEQALIVLELAKASLLFCRFALILNYISEKPPALSG